MMKKHKQTTIALSICTTLAAGIGTAQAQSPFAMQDLAAGYMVAENHVEGKCGGAKGEKEGKCGGKKEAEGKCGGDKKEHNEGKCGGEKKVKKEGKCGEGKCGGKK